MNRRQKKKQFKKEIDQLTSTENLEKLVNALRDGFAEAMKLLGEAAMRMSEVFKNYAVDNREEDIKETEAPQVVVAKALGKRRIKQCRKGYMRRKMLTKYDSVADFYEARLKGGGAGGESKTDKREEIRYK